MDSSEISEMPLPLRSRLVTSDLKVMPPRVMSTTSTLAFSEWTRQLGSASCSSLSLLSVMSIFFMLRVVSFESLYSGEKSSILLPSRYRVRRFFSPERAEISVTLFSERSSTSSVTRPESISRSVILFLERDALCSAVNLAISARSALDSPLPESPKLVSSES